MKRLRNKWLQMMLAAVLLFSTLGVQVGFAAENETNPTRFPDVPADHWAIKHVSKMALKGVITGYSDGTFGPSRNVSREEAITMAIRLMGLEEAAISSQVNIVLPFEVGSFFKPYINYAFDQGLLNIQEELNALGPNRSGERWGSSPASREWIAKLTIRMIEQEEAYSGTEMFSDQLDIAAWALGYVNAAVNLKIVEGRNGQFAPKDPVTRAEIATFFSRADIYLDEQPSSVTIGSVRQINSATITIQASNGQTQQLTIDSNTAIYTYAQNAAINYTAVQNGNLVYVIHHQGNAQYIEVLDDSQRTDTIQGRLVAPIQDSMIVIDVQGDQQIYELDFTSLEIIDTEGRGLNSASLVTNSTIELTYSIEENNDRYVTTIKLLRTPVNKKAEGKLQQLHRAGGEMVVEETTTGEEERYSLATELTRATAEIPYGNRTVALDELQTGDLVAYEVENDIVTSIELIEPLNPLLVRVEGTVTHNDLRDGVLYFESDRTLLGQYYASKVEVELEGVLLASEKDIVPGDEVVLYLDQNERIVKVTIKNRSIAAKHMVPFFSYDEETNSMVTREGRLTVYEVNSDTVFKSWNQTVIPHEQVNNTFREGQLLDIVYSTVTNQLISVTISNEYNGTIQAIDVSNRKMTIATEAGERITFDIPAGIWLEIPNQNVVTLSDFKVGDEVRASLNGSQTGISSLQLKQKVLYKVKEVNVSTRKLTLVTDKGTELDLTVPFQTVIKKSDNLTGEIRDILAGNDVFVSYVGRTVAQITIADVSYGKVTAVDHVNHIITFSDYNNRGTAKRLTIEPGTTLQVDDRIYVISDPEGGQSIGVMEVLERTYWMYDSAERNVYFYRPSVQDRADYTLHINALITQNGRTIQMSSLRDRDKVIVYLYNDIVMEIEKL